MCNSDLGVPRLHGYVLVPETDCPSTGNISHSVSCCQTWNNVPSLWAPDVNIGSCLQESGWVKVIVKNLPREKERGMTRKKTEPNIKRERFNMPVPVVCLLIEANKFSLIPSNDLARLIDALSIKYGNIYHLETRKQPSKIQV